MKEIWKPIPGFEGRYEASSNGKIKSLLGSRGNGIPVIRKTFVSQKGYETIKIVGEHGPRVTGVHVIVCSTFNGAKPTDRHQVNHKDGNKLNNHYSNLEWVTGFENIRHAFQNLDRIACYKSGTNHHRSKYSEEEIRQMRKMRENGHSLNEIRSAFGNRTALNSVHQIVNRISYPDVN